MNNHTQYTPRLIALEVTRKCPLNCKHCRAGALNQEFENELSLEEFEKIFDNISSFCKPIIIVTGGEPLERDDLLDIIRAGKNRDLKMVMATCGKKLTEEKLYDLKLAGIERLSFSIDAATKKDHDSFRSVEGSYDTVIAATRLANTVRIPFQINMTVTKENSGDIEKVIDQSIELGATSFHPFFLVPTGRAKSLKGLEMAAHGYEDALESIHQLSKVKEIDINVTCAPQYHRIAGIKRRACLAGTGFAFISHIGKIQTCGFLDIECGDLRNNGYNFESIWNESKILNSLRNPKNFLGKCGSCNYLSACSGCRARAHEINGNYLEEEPFCNYGEISD